MSAAPREAKRHDSRKTLALPAGIRTARALRIALAIAAAAGAICLVVATFSTIIEITVGTTSKIADRDTELSGYDRHSIALIVIALFAIVMAGGALRGARPAMGAVAVAGIAVLLIALIGDLPDVHKTGVIGQLYDNARANPRIGYYLETLGGALLLLAGGGLLVLGGSPGPAAQPAPPSQTEPAAER
jgi:amino acid transporter